MKEKYKQAMKLVEEEYPLPSLPKVSEEDVLSNEAMKAILEKCFPHIAESDEELEEQPKPTTERLGTAKYQLRN